MLTRLLAPLLALALGALAWMFAGTRARLDETADSAATEKAAAALTTAEARVRHAMEAEADRAAAFDFSTPLGASLATLADAEETDASKAAARAAVPAALGTAARASGADLLLVADGAGTVLARAEDPTLAGDSVAGYPPARDALRGAITDDLWVLSGKIYHVVGVPVLDLGTVVGAVLWARLVRSDDLIAALPGDEVGAALFHLPEEGPAVVHAATKAAGEAKSIAAILAASATELAAMRKEHRTHGPAPVDAGGNDASALFVPLPGQAGEAHGAGVLLLTEADTPAADAAPDVADTGTLGLLGGAALALLLALVLPFADARSRRREIAEAEAAADVRATRRATVPPPSAPEPVAAPSPAKPVFTPASTPSPAPSGAASGSRPMGTPTLQGIPGGAGLSARIDPRITQPPVPEPILASSEPEESLRSTVVDQPHFARSSSPTVPDPRPPLPTVTPDDGPTLKPGAHRPTLPYPASVPAGSGSAADPFAAKTVSYDAAAARESAAAAPPSPDPDEMLGDRTVVSSVSEVLARASAEEPLGIRKGGSASSRPSDDLHLGAKPPPPPGGGAAGALGLSPGGADAEEEAHHREVYQQFMATKQRCGEPMDLTYERFLDRLHATKKSLIERYQCRTVRFSPYVKAGKAALKATPVK